jgi:hypothetical protein
MGKIGFGYGSEWQLLWYLARHRDELSREVCSATGASSVHWLDFPRAGENDDAEWKGIDFITSKPVRDAWASFWPQKGNPPNWDAIGVAEINGSRVWLLVEAKAHAGELHSNCGASEAGGLPRIRSSFNAVKAKLGVGPNVDWLTGYYQKANRVAILSFLEDQGVAARLIHLYFCGDTVGVNVGPKTPDEWRLHIQKQNTALGLAAEHPLARCIHDLFLPVFADIGSDSRVQMVFSVGGEGGSLGVQRRRRRDWEFRVVKDERAVADIGGEVHGGPTQTEWNSLDSAFESLARYPWPRLMPLTLAKEYEEQVFAAIRRHPDGGEAAVQRWKDALGERP